MVYQDRLRLAAGWLVAAVLYAQPPQIAIDTPLVRTPPEVVRAMLKMAGVSAADVVYDLGTGDGRIAIAAARDFGARAVGVDNKPELIEEARRNARRAGVAARVTFRLEDLFETDLREATVVAMYLLADANLRLRPKLWRELKPGARVVSHDFHMGDWKPDKTALVNGSKIYLWTIR